MSETLDWATVRESAVQAFAEIPRADTEQEIVERFQAQPDLVTRLISQLSEERHKGQIRSCWAVLRKRLHDQGPTSNPTVQTGHERDKLVRSAEAWINNAGVHFDREPELLDELFGHHGKLRHYKDDQALKERMLQQWRTLRPADEKVEAEAQHREEQPA